MFPRFFFSTQVVEPFTSHSNFIGSRWSNSFLRFTPQAANFCPLHILPILQPKISNQMLRISHRRDGAVLAAHRLSTYMKGVQEAKPKYLDEHTWYCDNCGLQGGMTIRIQQCPECYHHRCPHCLVELRRFNVFVEPKKGLDPSVRNPDLYKSGLLAKPLSNHPVNNDVEACPHSEVP